MSITCMSVIICSSENMDLLFILLLDLSSQRKAMRNHRSGLLQLIICIIRWWFGTFSKINIIIPDPPCCCQSTPRFIFLSLFSPCEPLHLLQLPLLLLHARQCTVHLIPKCVHHLCCFTICLIFHQRIIGECGWKALYRYIRLRRRWIEFPPKLIMYFGFTFIAMFL